MPTSEREQAELGIRRAIADHKLRQYPAALFGLADYIHLLSPEFVGAPHLEPVLAVLERAEREPVRALISLPRRHGKTETIIHALAWFLRRRPELRVCYATRVAGLARAKSRKARRLAERAGLVLSDESASAIDWMTGHDDGGLFATSVGGDLVGRGFDLVLVDDTLKNRQEAESELVRETILEWFQSTLYPVLEPGSSCYVIGTRWHEVDLLGVLERERDDSGAPVWTTINLPAIADPDDPLGRKPGDALWPARWPIEALAKIRSQIGEYEFSAQYLGRPSSREGHVFRRAWLERPSFVVEPAALPPLTNICLSLDGAWKTGVGNDYSAISAWGTPFDRSLYVCLDAWRGRVELPDLMRALKAMVDKHSPHVILVEDSASGIAVIQLLRQSGLPVVPVKAWQSKILRAETVAPLFEADRVRLARGEWNGWAREELANFSPTCEHDDFTDTASMALTRLREGALVPPPRAQRPVALYGR